MYNIYIYLYVCSCKSSRHILAGFRPQIIIINLNLWLTKRFFFSTSFICDTVTRVT